MMKVFIDVLQFEIASGRPNPPDKPGDATVDQIRMALDLIEEEFVETREAISAVLLAILAGDEPDLEDLGDAADGLADLVWVCLAAAVRLGIDLPLVWERVAAANMAKFGPGAWTREDGKVMKGPDWIPPDVEGVLKDQCPIMKIYGQALACRKRREAANG